MNKFWKRFFIAGAIFFVASAVSAFTVQGEIIDIFGDNITTIRMKAQPQGNPGDTVDLVYMAGLLPMLIGQYEISTVQGNVLICKPLSQNMPPSKGMSVEVSWVRSASERGGAPAGGTQNVGLPLHIEDAQAREQMSVEGEVTEVSGEEVRIAFKGATVPQEGWTAELFYVTGEGKELSVGTWEVRSLKGQTVIASKLKGMGSPRPGLKALIRSPSAKTEQAVQDQAAQQGYPVTTNVSPGPGGAGSVRDLFSETTPGVFKDVQANQPPPLELLGESPPQDQNFFSQNFSKPQVAGVKRENIFPAPPALSFDEYMRELDSRQGGGQEKSACQGDAFGGSRRYWLGVEIAANDSFPGQADSKFPAGVRIMRVFPGSSAEKAKLQISDIIYEANGVQVTSAEQFTGLVNSAPQGKLKLKIQRDSKKFEKTIRLKEFK